MRNAELHFRLLAEEASDYAIFMLDKMGAIASWNPGAQRMLGYSEGDVAGQPMALFYPPGGEADAEPRRMLREAMENGRAEDDNWRMRKDGSRFWASGVLKALRDGQGRIRGFVQIMHDNTERRLAEVNTYFLANHDSLTGLANRSRFLERLNEALAFAGRDGNLVAVLLLDLDHFKLINDTMGHQAGDLLLKRVASRLSGCVRETDTVARLGGDEFALILTCVKNFFDVELLAAKLVGEMARPYHLGQQEVRSTASVGVAVYGRDGKDAGDLLQKADLAMYRAKAAGRSLYRMFAENMLTEVQARRCQEESLHHAIQHEEFELAFQPQIDLGTLRLSGAEVLLRTTNPILQGIPTVRMIALAEEMGLIVPIGEWVLKNACRQMRRWQERGLLKFKVAINFSPTHLLSPHFIDTVRAALNESALDPRFLELEVTEGVLVAANEANSQVMTALKETGVSISVDDFGTGFSALAYLKYFPVDVLKLDGSLVRHLPANQGDVAIVSAIIKLALELNIKVVAEGVENVDQLAYLRAARCDTGQGFLFSPAVRTEKFEQLLQNRKWLAPLAHYT